MKIIVIHAHIAKYATNTQDIKKNKTVQPFGAFCFCNAAVDGSKPENAEDRKIKGWCYVWNTELLQTMVERF